jgi:hypothetical protein
LSLAASLWSLHGRLNQSLPEYRMPHDFQAFTTRKRIASLPKVNST